MVTGASKPAHSPTRIVDPLPVAADRAELMRYLGYRGAAAATREVPAAMASVLRDAEALLHPRGAYAMYPVAHASATLLRLGGIDVRGRVATFLSKAERIAAFVVTVGREITDLAQAKIAEGDVVAAWALDALGSFAAEGAAHALSVHLQANLSASESLSARYSPGYCGMKLEAQDAVFGLLEAERVGVSLLPSLLMQPTKSVSGLLGVGPADAFDARRSACDECGLLNCSMRREAPLARSR